MATQTTSNTLKVKTGIKAGELPLNHHQPRHTWSPSHRQVHHGMLAIVGRLVLLSVFLLVFGVPSTPAQTGQDVSCTPYTGEAQRVCTAAVAAGCFAGVQSPDCDALTLTWNVSSLPILEKGEQFLRVIGIFALLCSHYKIRLF